MRLDGTVEESTDRQLELQAMEWQKQIEALTEDLDRLKAARSALSEREGRAFCLGHRLCRNLHRGKGRF